MDAEEYHEMDKRFRKALTNLIMEFMNEGLQNDVILLALEDEIASATDIDEGSYEHFNRYIAGDR